MRQDVETPMSSGGTEIGNETGCRNPDEFRRNGNREYRLI
jgi:hypothetical protein